MPAGWVRPALNLKVVRDRDSTLSVLDEAGLWIVLSGGKP